MKKVLIITTEPHPKNISLFQELTKYNKFEFQVFFVSGKAVGNWNYYSPIPIPYKCISAITIPIRFSTHSFKYYINPTILFDIIKINPDVIIMFGWDLFAYHIAFLYSKLFRKRSILWVGSTADDRTILRRLSQPFTKKIVKGSDAIIVYGTKAKQYVIELGANPDKVLIGINTLDIDLFLTKMIILKKKRRELRIKYHLPNKYTFIYVGQLIPRKGLDVLLRAFKNLDSESILLIIGDGSLRNFLEEKIGKEKLINVFLLGPVARDLLPEIYALSDVLILPSYQEVWGLVINEAMASGLAVIASDKVGAVPDLLKKDRNGFVFSSGNSRSLRNIMRFCINNPKILEKMGEQNMVDISKYTPGYLAQVFMDAINYIINL